MNKEGDTQKVQLVSIQSEWTLETLRIHLDEKIRGMENMQTAKWIEQDRRNQDANEWRGTIGDLKRDFVPRTEYDALVGRFVAEQLSVGKTLANTGGEKAGIGISWGAIVGAVGIVAAIVATVSFMAAFRSPSLLQPQVVVVPAQPAPAK